MFEGDHATRLDQDLFARSRFPQKFAIEGTRAHIEDPFEEHQGRGRQVKGLVVDEQVRRIPVDDPRAAGCRRLWLVTTNDNVPAISTTEFDVDENTPVVGTVEAADDDLPTPQLSFSIAGDGPDDHLFDIDILGREKTTHNLEGTVGVAVFF